MHSNAVKLEIIEISGCDGNGCRCRRPAGREIGDLGEVGGKCINGQFGGIFFVVADRGNLAVRW